MASPHADQLREHGGEHGLRDTGLLDPALARPRQGWAYDPECDLADLAAACGFGLVRNHPFVDGNKRIALVAMNIFLIINGSEIEAPEPEVVRVMLAAAEGSLEESELVEWVRSVMVADGE